MRALVAGLLLLAACDVPRAGVRLALVTETCVDTAPAPLEDATKLRISVTGVGATSTTVVVDRSAGSLELPAVETGTNRSVVVEALAADGSTVVARGETGPFTLEASEEERVRRVALRRVDTFTPLAVTAEPASCTTLLSPRAGHTTTLLGDGRLLVAGGYREEKQLGSTVRVYLDSTELVDPEAGTVTAGPRLSRPRAFHTATRIPGTTLTVLAGGEAASTGSALALAEIFDEATGHLTTEAMRLARKAHTAGATTRGGLVLVGGTDAFGTDLLSTEVFDAQTRSFGEGPVLPAAVGLASALVLDETRLLVLGTNASLGSDARNAPVALLRFESGRWGATAPSALALSRSRAWPALALLADGTVFAAGGTLALTTPSDALDLVRPSPESTVALETSLQVARARPSALTLRDGSVLVAGGVGRSAPVERFVFAGDVATPGATPDHELGGARHGTFTLLDDGTVVAVGGETGDGVVDAVSVFQPGY